MRQPWDKIGMSRASWYRHGKPTTKPVRVTQKRAAAAVGVSVRTAQRTARSAREAPYLLPLIERGELTAGVAELYLKSRPPARVKHRARKPVAPLP